MATPIMPEALQAIHRLIDSPAGSSLGIHPNGWCQRWRARQHSWRHVNEGGFDANRYVVTPLAERPAREFVEAHHYSAAWPASKLRYGLVDRWPVDEHAGLPGTRWLPWGQLVGTLVLGVPMQQKVLTRPFPNLVPYYESVDLARIVILDSVPANAESWFCARVFELAAEVGIRGVVAFSDPLARWRGNEMIMPGHIPSIQFHLCGAGDAPNADHATGRDVAPGPCCRQDHRR